MNFYDFIKIRLKPIDIATSLWHNNPCQHERQENLQTKPQKGFPEASKPGDIFPFKGKYVEGLCLRLLR